MKKIEVPIPKANRLINFGTVVLVTSKHENREDITPIAWNIPLSHNPMLVGISVSNKHFSNHLIEQSGEYVINVPDTSLVSKVSYCGSVSGRDVDKFEKSGLNQTAPKAVSVPLITECFAHIECKVVQKLKVGDHTFFVGEVLAASAIEGFLDEDFIPDLDKIKTLHHLGGSDFGTLKSLKA